MTCLMILDGYQMNSLTANQGKQETTTHLNERTGQ